MYIPHLPPAGIDPTLNDYLQSELQSISEQLMQIIGGGLPKLYEEPAKPREGIFANADGVQWNPGAGAGIYVYHNSTWKKIHV